MMISIITVRKDGPTNSNNQVERARLSLMIDLYDTEPMLQ